MTNAIIAAVVLAAMLALLVFGVLALLVFWHLASYKGSAVQTRGEGAGRWWTLLVGVATMTSAVVAVLNYLH